MADRHPGRPQAKGEVKVNPFGREGMAAKRAAIMDAVRAERGVSEPAKSEGQAESRPAADNPPSTEKASAGNATDVPGSSGADSGKPSDSNSVAPSNPSSPHHAEWVARERTIAAAEQKVRDAGSAAEARSAKAEADEAKAKQALADLAAAKNEPVEFLAKVGMTKDEWEHFMAQGGKMTPEAKRIKAMEARFNELETRYEAAQKKAEESARRAGIETENMQFAPKLGSYALLSKIGGIQAVRNKQAQVQAQQGGPISLEAAANLVEQEMRDNLVPLLKHEDVRRMLNLQIPDQPSGEAKKAPSTPKGSVDQKTTSPADPEETPAPWDWAAKKRLARKRMDLERIKRSAL